MTTEKVGTAATGRSVKGHHGGISATTPERVAELGPKARDMTVPDVITEAPTVASTRRIMAENDLTDEINDNLVGTTQTAVVSPGKTAPELGIAESQQTSKARLLALPKQLMTDRVDITPASSPCIPSHRLWMRYNAPYQAHKSTWYGAQGQSSERCMRNSRPRTASAQRTSSLLAMTMRAMGTLTKPCIPSLRIAQFDLRTVRPARALTRQPTHIQAVVRYMKPIQALTLAVGEGYGLGKVSRAAKKEGF